jgi:hypothetical protein
MKEQKKDKQIKVKKGSSVKKTTKEEKIDTKLEEKIENISEIKKSEKKK